MNHSTTVESWPGRKGAFLQNVPCRIEDFLKAYARDFPLTSEKFWLWGYARFLEDLLREVNQKIGNGETLSEEQIRSIATFADVQTVSSHGYVYPTWRGASGYDATLAKNIVSHYGEVLRSVVVAMGHALNVYYDTEKGWSGAIEKAWITRFEAAVLVDPLFDRKPIQPPPPLTPRSAAP